MQMNKALKNIKGELWYIKKEECVLMDWVNTAKEINILNGNGEDEQARNRETRDLHA